MRQDCMAFQTQFAYTKKIVSLLFNGDNGDDDEEDEDEKNEEEKPKKEEEEEPEEEPVWTAHG